ncbi:ABC transporter ATP-binding protein [Taibaiella chishuiensis]|uniref:ATP-binding cassette subfamily B protein n=1 Tax=Taibaiella chishuiensis TaxID=1434707 RepID=A0A2P8DCI5_9BACT|nr:ABC transporter ATP-binding protein [Taibaiella chishuiensis]PSK94938.1 ATP-binding cassette subfamily B protein [Taibaiella chishuiensis]
MEKKKAGGLSLLKRIFSYTRPYRTRLWTSIVLAIVLAVLAPVRPYLIQLSVDHYISNKLLQGLITITVIQLGILLLESVLRFVFMYTTNWLGQTVVNDIRQNVFKKIVHQQLSFFDNTPIGTLTTRTVNDIEAINDIFSEGLISIIADVLTIIAIMVIMLYTDWRLTLVSLSVFPVLILATYFFKESVNKSFHQVRNAVARLNAFVQEHITGMYVVQSFAAEDREIAKFTEINKDHRNANIKAIFAYSVFFPIVEIILAIAMGLLVWYGASRMLDYKVTQGVIIAFIMYLNLLFRPLRMLADKFNTLQMGLVAGERVLGVLDSEEYLHNNGTYVPAEVKGKVTFEQVAFEYKKDVPVLRGISFEARAGDTVALVGHTGAGKTSIISILNRLYEIKSGRILIDDKPLEEYDIHALRRHIGIVLQDVFLFSGTIYENITMRNHDIPLERVMEVCRLLGIHDFIMRLPGHYEFNVMERGNMLSQGQRQLLSFARALLYNPSILILDEATASVDTESEILIQQAIEKLIQGRTAIVIAHRLSTIRKANQIIVLDKGHIVEQGAHDELLQLKGIYQKMYTAAMSSEQQMA